MKEKRKEESREKAGGVERGRDLWKQREEVESGKRREKTGGRGRGKRKKKERERRDGGGYRWSRHWTAGRTRTFRQTQGNPLLH